MQSVIDMQQNILGYHKKEEDAGERQRQKNEHR